MFCPECGHKIQEASPNCPSCGARLSDHGAAAASTVNVYAGFWRRVAASLIDTLVVMPIVMLLVPVKDTGNAAGGAEFPWTLLALYVSAWLYSALLESSSRQATLGKMSLGIKVTDLNGQRIGFGRATKRFLGKYISSITLCIGFVMAGFTQRRQALHDKIAGTLVVRKDTDAARLAAHPLAPKVASWAAVLMVLAGAGAVGVGFVATIVNPLYQDSLIRAQVGEGLAAAAPYKAAVEQAVAGKMDWADITTESLRLEARAPSTYLASIEVVSGAVVLTFGDGADPKIAGDRLMLVPGVATTGVVVWWVCGYAPAPAGLELAIKNHDQYTTVEPMYLPVECRS